MSNNFKYLKKIKLIIYSIVILFIIILFLLLLFFLFFTFNYNLFNIIHNNIINNIFLIIISIIFLIFILLIFYFLLKKEINNILLEYYLINKEKLNTYNLFSIDSIPLGLVSYKNGSIELISDYFSTDNKKKLLTYSNINILINELENLSENNIDIDKSIKYYYNVKILNENFDIYHNKNENILYFFDKNKEHALNSYINENQIVIGFIYLDSPEEINVIEDSETIDIGSEVNKLIFNWAKNYNLAFKRYSSNRWILFTTKKSLDLMINQKMNIRKKIQELSKELNINITITGGFSLYLDNMQETLKNSVNAVELGQSRGGDQIVISNYLPCDTEKDLIIGGDNYQKKRLSRVSARNYSIKLYEEIIKTDVVYAISHKYLDFDSIGSLMGIYDIAKKYNKKFYCILDKNTLNKDILNLFNLLYEDKKNNNFEETFITPNESIKKFNTKLKKLIFILDTNNFDLLEINNIFHRNAVVFLIDHHRKSKKSISLNKPDIEYIDTMTSSTSELITELIQYQPVRIPLSIPTATFLLAGIILDTNNFRRNVSSRTFEAASILRKNGAVQGDILKVISSSINEYIDYSAYLKNSEKLPNNGRILIINNNILRQEVSKIAEFIISFQEIKYSIVIAKDMNNIVNISARSKGAINVQIILEHIGGGGHYNSAAVQLPNKCPLEIKQKLIKYINDIMKN